VFLLLPCWCRVAIQGRRKNDQFAGKQHAKSAIGLEAGKKKREGVFERCGRHDMILRAL
jgi:hypothetical protein